MRPEQDDFFGVELFGNVLGQRADDARRDALALVERRDLEGGGRCHMSIIPVTATNAQRDVALFIPCGRFVEQEKCLPSRRRGIFAALSFGRKLFFYRRTLNRLACVSKRKQGDLIS